MSYIEIGPSLGIEVEPVQRAVHADPNRSPGVGDSRQAMPPGVRSIPKVAYRHA